MGLCYWFVLKTVLIIQWGYCWAVLIQSQGLFCFSHYPTSKKAGGGQEVGKDTGHLFDFILWSQIFHKLRLKCWECSTYVRLFICLLKRNLKTTKHFIFIFLWDDDGNQGHYFSQVLLFEITLPYSPLVTSRLEVLKKCPAAISWSALKISGRLHLSGLLLDPERSALWRSNLSPFPVWSIIWLILALCMNQSNA